MTKISMSEGIPIARIEGGKYNNKIVYINSNNESPDIEVVDIFDKVTENELRKNKKRLSIMDIEKLKHAIKNNNLNVLDSEELINLYNSTKKTIDDKRKTELILNDSGIIIPVPSFDNNFPSRYYISGPSGSGKSTFISNIYNEYKKIFPKNKMVIFSRVSDDECLDIHKPIRIMIDENLLTDEIDIQDELSNSFVIFDDIDTIQNKKLREYIQKLRDDISECGRHFGITCANTSHQLMNYRVTRNMINEATDVTIFPRSGSVYHIRRFLKEYIGCEQDKIKKIINLPSRWVIIRKTYPITIIYSGGIFLI